MEASKSEIKSIQGLSVLAMLCLHLFCRYNFSNLYTPAVYLFGYPICFYFAQISDFCVMGFAFCSGYAHSILLDRNSTCSYFKNRIISIMKLLCNFWIILIAFSVLSFLIGNGSNIPGSLNEFLGNFFLYKLSYNGAWWYLITYILIVFTSVPIIRVIKKYNSIILFLTFFVIYFISYIVRFKYPSTNWFVQQAYLYGMTLFEYVIGVFFHKHYIFTKTTEYWKKIPLQRTKHIAIIVSLIILTLFHTLIFPSLFIAPFTGIIILVTFHLYYTETGIYIFFKDIGNHSTNMWLTHMFFFEYIFTDMIFAFGYPILIFVALVSITILTSIILKTIQNPVSKVIDKIIYY